MTPEQHAVRELVYAGEDNPRALTQGADPRLVAVGEVMAQTESGRAALETLHTAGVTVHLVDSGGETHGYSYNADRRELTVDTHNRSELDQAAALVAAAAHLEGAPAARSEGAPAARSEGAPAARSEGAPAVRPEDARTSAASDRLRGAAESFGREAEFVRELREAGYDPERGPLHDAADTTYTDAVRDTYHRAADAAADRARAADPNLPADRARELAHAAGVEALLSDDRFTGAGENHPDPLADHYAEPPAAHDSTTHDPTASPRDQAETPRDAAEAPRDPAGTERDAAEAPRDPAGTLRDANEASRDPAGTPRVTDEAPRDAAGTPRDPVEAPRDSAEAPREAAASSHDPAGAEPAAARAAEAEPPRNDEYWDMREFALNHATGSDISRWALETLGRHGVDIRVTDDPAAAVASGPKGHEQRGPLAGYDPATNTLVLHRDSSPAEHAAELVRAASELESRARVEGPLERYALSRDDYVRAMRAREAEALALGYEHNRTAGAPGDARDRARPTDPLERAYRRAHDEALRTAREAYKGRDNATQRMLEAAAYRAGVREVEARLADLGPRVEGRDPVAVHGAEWDRAHGIPESRERPQPPRPTRDTPQARDTRAREYADEIEHLRALREAGSPIPVGPAEHAYREARAAAAARPHASESSVHEAGLAGLRRYLKETGLHNAEIAFDVVRTFGESGETHWGNPNLRDMLYRADTVHQPAAESPRLAQERDRALARSVSDIQMSKVRGGFERLTDNVVLVRDSTRSSDRLIVFAGEGGHMRALQELADAHPRYANALTNRFLRLEYREINPDGEHGAWVHELSHDEAEGSMRRPSNDEALGELLSHYLRYREDGRVTVGFDKWLRGLGDDAFVHPKQPLRARLRGAEPPVRLSERFLTAGQRTAESARSLDHPHAAAVARDLLDRKVELGPRFGPDAHRYRMPDRFTMHEFEVGGSKLRLWLERDGEGGWRVPAATGRRDMSDALAHRFQGMTDKDPVKLANRIRDALTDPTAPLRVTEPERSRSLWQRMTDRFGGRDTDAIEAAPRAGEGPAEQPRPQRSPAEEPRPEGPAQRRGPIEEPASATHPGKELVTDEPAQHDSSGERDNDHAATDSESPDLAPDWSPRPDDAWSGLENHERIAEKLAQDWKVDVTGFSEHHDLEALREYARAVEKMFTDFPGDTVRPAIHVGPLDEPGVFAETTPGRTADGRITVERITFNERFAHNPDELAQRVARAEEAGYLTPGSAQRPVYSTIVHEFAHALDFAGGLDAHHLAFDAMMRHYLETRGSMAGFEEWFADQRGYAFDEHGRWDPAEAMAEAFTDDVLNGAQATEQSKVLSQALIDAHQARVDRASSDGADRPASGGEDGPAEPAQRRGLPGDEHGNGESAPTGTWMEQQRAIGADWTARMVDQRLAFLREAAELYAPGTEERRIADAQIAAVAWESRMATQRADFLWEVAGGRPEQAGGESS
ncbi:hypothetical protein, partial [Nocardia sp. NPDC004722]